MGFSTFVIMSLCRLNGGVISDTMLIS